MARTGNQTYTETSKAQFDLGTITNTQVTTDTGGEIKLGVNNKGKWCSPSFASSSIDLPDGPPVAVAANASSSLSVPNDIFVATAPSTSNPVKLAYVNVMPDTDSPVPTLRGVFTLDPTKFTSGAFPSGIGIDNNFKTNDVKYYKSSAGKIYALMATNLPNREIIAILIDDGDPSNDGTNNGEYQDNAASPKIYKYWTFFNTRIYASSPNVISDTGFRDPTADSPQSNPNNGDGNGFVTSPDDDAYHDDSEYAVDANSGTTSSTSYTDNGKDRHVFSNYNFLIPANATITGIQVRLDARVGSTSCATTRQMHTEVSWDGGTSWTTPSKATSNLSASMSTYNLPSGSSDTWGHTWSQADLTNSNFRLRITDVANDTDCEFRLDWAAVKIYYNDGNFDRTPYGYGATALKVFENKGYALSGGFLYVFDLSNIDSLTDSERVNTGLSMIGCRIRVGGATGGDCQPGSPNGSYAKYTNGQSGATYGTNGTPSHNTCSDGGNVALYADEAVDVARVSSASNNLYAFIAIGGIVGEELSVVKVQTVPSNLSSNTCGVSDGTDWKQVGTLDFNDVGGSEEASNSIYAKSDGSRVYMTSNGGADSKQFYVLDTSTPSAPKFLNGATSGIPTNGFYNGASPAPAANSELFPKRSLTVLNGNRAVLVGRDGISNSNNAEEYQVINMEPPDDSETTPTYCGGLDFDDGFNDLTSISEVDGDNYVYMVANTALNELKIIQGGPDNAIYVPSGTYESKTFDTNSVSLPQVAFNRFSSNVTLPASTTLKIQVAAAPAVSGSCAGASFNYVGPNGDPAQYFIPTTSVLTATIPFGNYLSNAYQNPGRCFRYKTWLSTTDQTQTPILSDFTTNYSP
jgi:hypothetical protein